MSAPARKPGEAVKRLRQSLAMEHGYFVGLTKRSDGRYTWIVLSEMAAELNESPLTGHEPTWVDALLLAADSIKEPSDEGVEGSE